MFNHRAITRIQSIILIAIIVVAAVSVGIAYVLLNSEESSETIKIGVLGDLDSFTGKKNWRGAVLALEQINQKGGILGKSVELIKEDMNIGEDPIVEVSSALTRLITLDKVDYVIGTGSGQIGFMIQEIIAEHKIIFIDYLATTDSLTQRVLDDYDKYKYFFKYNPANTTQLGKAMLDQLLHIRDITGFNKIGYLAEDLEWTQEITDILDTVLPEVYGFDLVYKGKSIPDTVDFSSYFAAAEAAGVEILMPLISGSNGIIVAKEYNDRQSPMIIYGGLLGGTTEKESWEQTDGKCSFITGLFIPVNARYPLTNKTLPFCDVYENRWNENASYNSAVTYDTIRFVLADALERAGSMDTEAVIKALENIEVETTLARHFAFTSSHDVLYKEGMFSDPDDYGHTSTLFQWQEDGKVIPIYPKWLMEEAGSTYQYPPWSGPWDNS